jgi:hypothetical protein
MVVTWLEVLTATLVGTLPSASSAEPANKLDLQLCWCSMWVPWYCCQCRCCLFLCTTGVAGCDISSSCFIKVLQIALVSSKHALLANSTAPQALWLGFRHCHQQKSLAFAGWMLVSDRLHAIALRSCCLF